MKPAVFEFVRARTLSEATTVLLEADGAARVVAGAQSLGPMLNLRLVQPRILVDVTGIAELTEIDDRADAVTLGACITTANIEDGRLPGRGLQPLSVVAGRIAYRAVRNRGTIGGSVCHADPAADWISALCALGAQCVIAGPGGPRRLAVEDFVTGAFENALAPGELLQGIRIPRLSAHGRWGYNKLCRKAGEFALAIGVVVDDRERNSFRAVIGATRGRPIIVTEAREIRRTDGTGLDATGRKSLVRSARHHRSGRPPPARRGSCASARSGNWRMKPIRLTVNGRQVVETVEARTHLADFLREKMNLTGTHLRCEQGVCGACTLLIDGQPARSCITYAVMCDGAVITTIEGLDDDPVMAALRRAFSEEHGLQCGFCTPAMLVTARDIIARVPEADEARIRLELSGNLCRCTGYVGIVRAIRRVLKECREGAFVAPPLPSVSLGPVGARVAHSAALERSPSTTAVSISERSDSGPAQDALGLGGRRPNIELLQSFEVSCPPQDVWEFFGDIERVVRCLPGASLTRPPDGDRVDGKFSARLGPITATFTGAARIVRDDEKLRGVVLGAGNDRLSGSRAAGEIEYVLLPAGGGTRVELVIRALLAGPLAQFGRSGIVEDLVSRVAQAFARNLEGRLMGSGSDIETPTSAPLAAGSLLRQVLATRLKAVLARLFHLVR